MKMERRIFCRMLLIIIIVLISIVAYLFIKTSSNDSKMVSEKLYDEEEIIYIEDIDKKIKEKEREEIEKAVERLFGTKKNKEKTILIVEEKPILIVEEETGNIQKEEIRSIIITDTDVEQYRIDYLIDVLDQKVPDDLLKEFIKKDWKVILTENNIAPQFGINERIQAITDYNNRRIYIEARAMNTSTLHEFGHFFDYLSLFECSKSDEFKQIYEEEGEIFKSRIINPHCVSNQTEFFAEGFYYYLQFPEMCTPKLYEYIKRKYNEYEKATQN